MMSSVHSMKLAETIVARFCIFMWFRFKIITKILKIKRKNFKINKISETTMKI